MESFVQNVKNCLTMQLWAGEVSLSRDEANLCQMLDIFLQTRNADKSKGGSEVFRVAHVIQASNVSVTTHP